MNSSDFEFGFVLHNRGEFAQAWGIYENFIRENPKHYDVIYSLGVLHTQ